MKTGQEVLERAMLLLGYTNSYGEIDGVKDAELLKRGASAVIQIYNDLKRIDALGEAAVELSGMADVILLSPETIDDVMPYGVAMMIAQNEGDGDSQALYAALYNQKRSSVPHKTISRLDVLPGGGC